MSVNLAVPIRDAIVAASSVTSNLSAYQGSFPVFTRRPVPDDAPELTIVVSPDVTSTDGDGISDRRPVIERDVAIYGKNSAAAKYRAVETVAYAVQSLFHRERSAIVVPGWSVTEIIAHGPIAAPTDDEQTVGRVVMLAISLAKRV